MKRLSRSKLRLACIVLSVVLVSISASAQRIVLLRPRGADPALLEAFGRLKGELMSHDFEVIVVDAEEVEASPRRLGKVAEQARAVASISLVRSEGLATADVWISDRVTGKTTMRTIATAANREASSVLAIRAVDLLRTSLREFPAGEKPPTDVVGASPERAPAHVREWAAQRPERKPWAVDAGIALQSTLSTLGSVYGPSIAVGYNTGEHFGFALVFQGPLTGAHASADRASVSLENEQLFGEVRYRPVVQSWWALEATGALGAHRFDVEGRARAPYVGRSDSALTGLAALGLGFELRLASSAALVAFGRALWLAPRPVVRIADSKLSYGHPAAQLGANLRVEF